MEATHVQLVDFHPTRLEPAQPKTPDRERPDRQRADREGAESNGSDRQRTGGGHSASEGAAAPQGFVSRRIEPKKSSTSGSARRVLTKSVNVML